MTSSTLNQNENILKNKDIFPDRPAGLLDRYRNKATFDYRKLTLIFYDEKCLTFRNQLWKYLEEEPLFAHSLAQKSLDEERHLATKRFTNVIAKNFVSLADHIFIPDITFVYMESMMAYDPGCTVKASLSTKMFPGVLRTMGNDSMNEIAEAAENGEIVGAFALTEIAHGSNTLGMRTTAHFDTTTKQFILHTPDFEAAKCWAGNLGKTCTHAIVYAQLYTPDGQHHGLCGFVVPIRDVKNLKPLPGVTVGDMGEKIGLNGVDNGFVMFDHYRIPKDSLLSKLGYMTDEGQYVTPIKDIKKRIGASFGALSGGRVNICGIANNYLTLAITIAIRYSACRKQFKDSDSIEEVPVLEYQSQQYRLLPHLATTIAQKVFVYWQIMEFAEFNKKLFGGEKNDELGMEIHAISTASKSVCTWAVRDAIQDCRESTGGHGYLKVARFGELRNDNDPNCTYEGENNVLLQQASNWMLSIRKNGFDAFKNVSPLGTVSFLVDGERILKNKFTAKTPEEAVSPNVLLRSLNWLTTYYLEKTFARSQNLKNSGLSDFEVRNDMQVFHAQNLSIVYGQRTIYKAFYDLIEKLDSSPERIVLTKLLSLYGANLLLKHMACLYEGGYLSNAQQSDAIKFGVLDLMKDIKDEAVAIIDAIAPSDFILNSPLGMSDGDIYKHLQSAMCQSPGAFERVDWWKDVTHWKKEQQINAKL